MKVSRNWLQTFFDTDLPDAGKLEELLTFHSSEIEEVEEVGDDAVLDVKVLPDKSAWMLSHRGIAKELSTILELPLAHDPLAEMPELAPTAEKLSVTLDTERCARYAAAVVRGVKVGPSPQWLKVRLEAIGQRSINNVVDATNYVMFHLGQPLHAFDAAKLTQENKSSRIGVRMAREGEIITVLTGEEYTLTSEDMLIVDGASDTPIGIAGVKGGKRAEVDTGTTDIILESANFNRVSVRKTAQRLKLRTDASARFENGVVPELAGYGLAEAAKLIADIAGGTVEGYVDVFPSPRTVTPVSVSLEKLNSVLGLSLAESDVVGILDRFGHVYEVADDVFTITPPFERDDLNIPEDLIEEVGRIYGLEHIQSEILPPAELTERNKLFFHSERVRDALIGLGFSEVYTSSFRKKDTVKLANALAADKGYLRSSLKQNLDEALARNVVNKDLLGLERIALFEIGSVFDGSGEHVSLGLGVRTGQTYSPKKDDALLNEALDALAAILGSHDAKVKEGIAEIDLGGAVDELPEPEAYDHYVKRAEVTYQQFSQYPFVSRDIALWVAEGVIAEEVEQVLTDHAGELLVRTTLFDEFTKDGRISYAFRLVFQSPERTLTDDEVNAIMDKIYAAVAEKGWEVR